MSESTLLQLEIGGDSTEAQAAVDALATKLAGLADGSKSISAVLAEAGLSVEGLGKAGTTAGEGLSTAGNAASSASSRVQQAGGAASESGGHYDRLFDSTYRTGSGYRELAFAVGAVAPIMAAQVGASDEAAGGMVKIAGAAAMGMAAMGPMGAVIGGVSEALAVASKSGDELTPALTGAAGQLQNVDKVGGGTAKTLLETSDMISQVSANAGGSSASVGSLHTSFDQVKESSAGTTQVLSSLTAQFEATHGGAQGLSPAMEALQQANENVASSAESSDGSIQAQATTLRAAQEQVIAFNNAMGQAGSPGMMTGMSDSAKAALEFGAALNRLQSEIDAIHGKDITVRYEIDNTIVTTVQTPGGVPAWTPSGGFAQGGGVTAGQTFRALEMQPEYFRAPTSGQVIPLSGMGGAGSTPSGGGGTTVIQNFNFNNNGTIMGMNDARRWLLDQLQDISRSAGSMRGFTVGGV